MKLDGVCKDCRFYDPDNALTPAQGDGNDATCRFYPQRPLVLFGAPGPTVVHSFGRTRKDLGCGQFDKEKP